MHYTHDNAQILLFIIDPHIWSCNNNPPPWGPGKEGKRIPFNSFKPSPFSTLTTMFSSNIVWGAYWCGPASVRCRYPQSNVTTVALCCTSIGIVGGIMHWSKLHRQACYARVSVFRTIGTCLHTCVSFPFYSKLSHNQWKQAYGSDCTTHIH